MSTHSIPVPPSATPSRPGRRRPLLGILSITPLFGALLSTVLLFVTMATSVSSALSMEPGAEAATGWELLGTITMIAFGVAAVSWVVALVVFIIDACVNPALTSEQRPMWLIVLILGNALAFAPYWYVVWWRGRDVSDAR